MNAKQFSHFHKLCQRMAATRAARRTAPTALDLRVAAAKASLRSCLPRSARA